MSDTSLVFTTGDWGTAQSVTVTGVDDDDARGETVNVSLSAGRPMGIMREGWHGSGDGHRQRFT